jgi:hypothetical protein
MATQVPPPLLCLPSAEQKWSLALSWFLSLAACTFTLPVRTLRAEDADLRAMHYLDYSATYCSVNDALDVMVAQLTGTGVFSALDTREYVILPEDFAVPEKYIRRTEDNAMVVTDTELYWKALVHHTSVVVSTSCLSWIQVEARAQAHAIPIPSTMCERNT